MVKQSYSKEKAIEVAQVTANQNKRVVYVLEIERGKFIPATICHSIEKCVKRIVPN